jgi:hypothetical protein
MNLYSVCLRRLPLQLSYLMTTAEIGRRKSRKLGAFQGNYIVKVFSG